MKHRDLMRRMAATGCAALLCLLFLSGKTLAHDPVVFLPAPAQQSSTHTPHLEQLYRLFSDLCLLFPTPRQRVTLAEAEAIYALLYGWRPKPRDAAEVEQVTRAAQRHYEALREDYPVTRVQWEEAHLHTRGPHSPIPLTQGLERGLLVEVENRTAQPLPLSPRREGEKAPCAAAQTIPAGETRTFAIPIKGEALETRSLAFWLEPSGSGASGRALRIPVTVSPAALLRGKLWDARTGRIWPGRVQVLGSDGLLRHGKAYSQNTTVSEKPVVFRPASYKLPFFYSDGTFEIAVPPGKTQVTLERGYEHRLAHRTVSLKPGETREITLKSGRFLDMKARGWISGDTHVHWVKNSWDSNESLSLLGVVQRAEDVRVINNLTLYQYRPADQGGIFIKPDHHPMGPVPGMCNSDWHVQMGEEYRNDNHYGHLNLLGITRLIQPLATGPGSGGPPGALDFPLNRTAIEEARRQGGISVEAHNLGPFYASDVPVNVALGLSDSLDQLEPQFYYRFLNSGFHIGLTNGSDHPARLVGCVRCYVRVEGAFTYRNWIEGVRQGRTFTTSGPLLSLSVNGKDIGDTLDVQPGEKLRIRARALSRFPLGALELVSNGEILKHVTTHEKEATLEMELTAEQSRWFCVRASRSGNYDALSGPDIAHSSALYVRVHRNEVVRKAAVLFWIENVRTHYDRVKQLGNFANDTQRQEALSAIREGLSKYEALLQGARL